jgi:hypothetical protein
LLFFFLARQLIGRFFKRTLEPTAIRMACALGAIAFLVEGVGAGVPLTVGQVSVWAGLLWLLISFAGIATKKSTLS